MKKALQSVRFGFGITFPSWVPMVGVICLFFGGALASAQGQDGGENSLGSPGYRNRLYATPPNAIPGVTGNPSSRALTVYSGNVGKAGAASTPHNTTHYLVQSGLGHPVAEASQADFSLGEEIIPDPALQVDLKKKPKIVPEVRAFHVAQPGKVIAADPGIVFITWYRADNSEVPEVRYLIDRRPVREPVGLYHTHNPDANFKASPPVPKQTLAPSVNVTTVQEIVFHWNTAIPAADETGNPYVVRTSSADMFARVRTGVIVLEYKQNNQFLGVELVEVRSNLVPDGPATTVDLGFQLLPYNGAVPSEPPQVVKGIGTSDVNTQFVYQHSKANSPQKNHLFAIRKAETDQNIEVYWMRRGILDVVWPFELHRYKAAWPTAPARYQIYVRGSTQVLGPNVQIPNGTEAHLLPFQEPQGHANEVASATFSTKAPGLSLLRYDVGDAVKFQVVRSVVHNNFPLPALAAVTPINWPIGKEITEESHDGPRAGYIHYPEGNRYDWEIYDGNADDPAEFTTKQVFAVNEGLLEVWWSNVNQGVQWPSLVKRYNCVWPVDAPKLVIASLQGSGPIDPITHRNYRIYFQNDPQQAGFNPNDEHALLRDGGAGESAFALRDDLGTPTTSKPHVLLKSRDPEKNLRWRYEVFRVVAEDPPILFSYSGVAGTLIQPPFPLSVLQLCPESSFVSGPVWRDRKLSFWAMAAGNNGPTDTSQIVMRYFYPVQTGFFFPDAQPPAPGAHVPWLDRRPGGTPGVPTDVRYVISWPDAPELSVAETLVRAKFNLPDISLQTSAQILYQQSVALGQGPSVRLIDPTREHEVALDRLPGDVPQIREKGLVYFSSLPPHLRKRIHYDPTNKKLKFRGEFIRPVLGEDYILLNVITAREKATLLNLSPDGEFRTAINALSAKASDVLDVPPDSDGFDSMALTAGLGRGTGFVTLAFGNNSKLTPESEPVALKVIKVSCPTYRGEVKAIESENPLDEKITLRHSGDFAGKTDTYVFEWRTLPPVDGLPPTNRPPADWAIFSPKPATGDGAVDITIEGAGLFTLTDNYFICRYRPAQSPVCPSGANVQGWSDWTQPQLAEGWIKRVVRGINPFEQKIKSYQDNRVNTIVSMISQAGNRFEGSVPLSLEAVNQLGLIEVYETVLQRGMDLSVNGLPPVNYGPANDALLLAAGRLADLYMLLGNEAYADASDPTIAFGTGDSTYGSEATSIHCFMNQTPSLIEEELALLRGRDNALLPPVTTPPVYNRLVWNFTSDINGGEVAYALNYNIRNESGDVAGTIDEADAKALYPQGHGDAWGHYLTAVKNYYRLLQNPNFTWVPRIEAVLVGGAPVSVDFLDERKFAAAASARARTGAEIASLTYRNAYVEDPEGQWQGYQDTQKERAWGLSEWATRAGQGAFFDWVMANALLPDKDRNPAHVGIQKVDRSTVSEIRDITAAADEIQGRMDMADAGLNPLGLAKNVVPFDIDPAGIVSGKTHFEQIYERAVRSVNNAIAVFNHANNSSQLLRRQADDVAKFQEAVGNREADFNSRLIEVFGYPYSDDIGPTGTYPSGYDGPDLYNYEYVDVSELFGETPGPTQQFTLHLKENAITQQGELISKEKPVTFSVSTEGLGLIKPPSWTGKRRSPGEIQMARSELLQTQARFRKALFEYINLREQIEDEAALIRAQHDVNADEIKILNEGKKTQEDLNFMLKRSTELQQRWLSAAKWAQVIADATAEFFPTDVGFSVDATSVARGGIKLVAGIAGEVFQGQANDEALEQVGYQQAKEMAASQQSIQLTTLKNDFAVRQAVQKVEQLVRQEALMRLEVFTLRESLQQSIGKYTAVKARGARLLEDLLRFRQQTATQVQAYRYKDMAFRIFRNDALQKYRAQFDLASMYVYLAARAYDFETNLGDNDSRGPGVHFMTTIVRARSLGLIENGQPQTGSGRGDPGLADPMARMFQNWELVLKGQLGFNNPQTETGRFSLRSELLRIQGGASGNAVWRKALESYIQPNLFNLPEFVRYCSPFLPHEEVEPGLVIPFATTVNFGQNFFGWPAGGGDNDFDSTHFATKIRSVGVWFANYNNLGGGMINSPRVYLIPVGNDVLRSPTGNLGQIREWKILDQKLPVPFSLGTGSLSDPKWIPVNNTLTDELAGIRQFARFRAYHDSGNFDPAQTINDSRLIGRSVWNTRWLLIIPAGTLHNDRNEGLQRFINGALKTDGERDGNGILDIKIFFQTYAYSGN